MAIRISRPVQNLQLKYIGKNNGIDYQTLRTYFDLQIDDFENQLYELVHLALVKKEKINDENIYTITEEGRRANKIGLNEFTKRMVLKEAELFLYPRINKSTTLLEENAVRQLENSGKIFFNGKGYKVVPSKEYEEQEKNALNTNRFKLIKFLNHPWTITVIGGFYTL